MYNKEMCMKKILLTVFVLLVCSGCTTTKGTWFPTVSDQEIVEQEGIIWYEVKF